MAHTFPFPLAEYTDRFCPEIEAALQAQTPLGDGCPRPLADAIRYSLLAPGKRLRPLMTLMAAEACGGDVAAAMPAACAIEMVHAYSLIHDDLPAMDDDDLRRGQPTNHKVFGEALAILAGDALLSMAFQAVSQGVQPPEVAAACCAVLAEASGPCQLVGGQADDVAGGGDGGGLAGLESMHRRKTGAMMCAALRMGALTARATDVQLAALEQYGRGLGLAFQITDDLLDVRSDQRTAGKRVQKDAEKGKLTFPRLLGVDESAAYARKIVAEACGALSPLGSRAAGLESLARYVLERIR
jgi:geranylgeranyl diphosphate synthase, type II